MPAVLLVQGDRRLEVRGNVENRRESSDVARFHSGLEESSSGPRSPVRRRDEEPGYDAERLRRLAECLAGLSHYLIRRDPIEGDVVPRCAQPPRRPTRRQHPDLRRTAAVPAEDAAGTRQLLSLLRPAPRSRRGLSRSAGGCPREDDAIVVGRRRTNSGQRCASRTFRECPNGALPGGRRRPQNDTARDTRQGL